MSINLTPESEQLLHGIYAAGGYASESDVVAVALQLLQQRDRLKSELQCGINELDRGERIEADVVFRDLRRRAAELDGPHS